MWSLCCYPDPNRRPRLNKKHDSNYSWWCWFLMLWRWRYGKKGWNPNVQPRLKTTSLEHQTCMHVLSLSRSRLFVTPWTVASQAPLSMGFPRQEYWSRLPCPPPGDLPDPGIKSVSPMSPALEGRLFTTEPLKKPRALWLLSKLGSFEKWPLSCPIFFPLTVISKEGCLSSRTDSSSKSPTRDWTWTPCSGCAES